MIIHRDHSLKHLNTFGVEAHAKYFVEIDNENELESFLRDKSAGDIPMYVLGGGSNVLFKENYDGLILKYRSKGISVSGESHNDIFIEISAGEVWDDLVTYCVQNNYYGIENLTLIPGNVGAAPIQNIGAYGVELKDVFESLEGYYIDSGFKKTISKEKCMFGYRDSIFKRELKNKFLITKIVLKLSKERKLDISYKSLADELKNVKEKDLTIKVVSDTVKKIRESKLADPKILGNAGSFFKNPVIPINDYINLRENFPDIPSFPFNENSIKIPAGWLIEKCGLKGKRIGNVGTFEKQSLVIVNHGSATGEEILSFAESIKKEVKDKFGIEIVPEVNIV